MNELHWTRWKTECARVLYNNLPTWQMQKQLRYRYTSPASEKLPASEQESATSIGKYLPQWLWDSCFHAMAYRWFDEAMAWEELLSLLSYPVEVGHPDAGMIPHMQHLSVANDKAAQRLFRHPFRSNITQPPLIGVAALRVHEQVPRDDYLRLIYDSNKRHHDWLNRRRVDDDHLAVVIYPWEVGWDASQRWDEAMDITDPIEQGMGFAEIAEKLNIKRQRLMQNITYHNGDWRKLDEVGSFIAKPIDFNAIRVADLQAMAVIAKLLDKSDEAIQFLQWAEESIASIQKKMITRTETQLFGHDLVMNKGTEQPSMVDSAAKFVLLFGDCVDRDGADLLKNEIDGIVGQYAAPYQIPTVPMNTPTFDATEYWRGNVWMPLNWLVYMGLRHYGFMASASALVQNSRYLIDLNGFCEFFDPITGERGQTLGIPAPQNQSWTTIILDMLGTERLLS